MLEKDGVVVRRGLSNTELLQISFVTILQDQQIRAMQ